MGLFSEIWNSVKNKRQSTYISGYSTLFGLETTLGIKSVALEACTTYLARLISKGKFVFKHENSIMASDFDYALNVRPNPNQTASEFKIAMVKKLLNGELLVVRDGDKFYVADNFVTHYSLNGNTFSDVVVNFDENNVVLSDSGLSTQKYFEKIFTQGVDCFHLANDNIELQKYIDSLWKDYGKMFGILITNQLRVGQLRAKISDPVVFVPADGTSKSSYDEISANKSASLQNQITDFGALRKVFIGEVSALLGIPPALVLGETANNSENLDLAIEAAVLPIGNKLSEGFTSLLIKESGYKVGKTLSMTGFKTINILERADAIDKVGSSGVVKINEVREAAGLPAMDNGDKVIMTKNYTKEGENSENI